MKKTFYKINNNAFIETVSDESGLGSSALFSYNTFIFSITSSRIITVSKQYFCYSTTTSKHITKSGLLLPKVQDIIKKAIRNNKPENNNNFEYEGFTINLID